MPKFYEEFTDSCLKTDTKRSECRYSTIPFFKSATISKSIKLPNSRTEVPALNDGSLSTKKVRNPRGHHEYGEFSLNKRKRWTLANDFRKNIESWNELPNVSVEVIEVAHRLDNLGGSEGIRNSASRTTSYHSYANGRPIHRYPLKTFAKCETLQGREVKKQRKQQKTPSKNETVEKDHANEKGFKPPEIEVTYTIKTPFRSLSLYEKYRKNLGPSPRKWQASNWRNPMRKSCYDKHKKYTELGNFIDENLQDFSLENPIDSFCDYQCCDFGPQYKTRVFKRDIDEFLVQPKSERLLEEAMKLRDIRISTLTSDSESFVLISDLETEEDCEAEKEPEEINQGTVSQKCEDFPVTDKGSINYNTQCRFCDKLSHWPADCTQAGRYHCYLEDNGFGSSKVEQPPLITTIRVKLCPRCGAMVESSLSYCQYNVCACKHEFCYGCLKPYRDAATRQFFSHDNLCFGKTREKVVQLVDIKCFKQRLKWRERCLAHRDWKARSYGALRKNIEKCFGIFASEQGSNEFSLSLFKQIVETIIQIHNFVEYLWVWYYMKPRKQFKFRILGEQVEFLLQLIEMNAEKRNKKKLIENYERLQNNYNQIILKLSTYT